MTLGVRIKYLRQQLGLTQKEFGQKIGVSAVTISTSESGKTKPDEQTIRILCSTFGIRREWLEEGTEPMYIPELDTDDLEIDLIFSRQTEKERDAIKKLLNLPGGRDMFAKFATLTINGIEQITEASKNAEKE